MENIAWDFQVEKGWELSDTVRKDIVMASIWCFKMILLMICSRTFCSYMQQLISNTNSSPEEVEYVHGFHPVSKLTEIRQAACVKLHKAVLWAQNHPDVKCGISNATWSKNLVHRHGWKMTMGSERCFSIPSEKQRERERQRDKIIGKGKLGTPKQLVCLPAFWKWSLSIELVLDDIGCHYCNKRQPWASKTSFTKDQFEWREIHVAVEAFE